MPLFPPPPPLPPPYIDVAFLDETEDTGVSDDGEAEPADPATPAPAKKEGWKPKVRTEADFLPGDVDLKARIGFNGSRWDPLSLFISLPLGWLEFNITVDFAVAEVKQWTFAIGFDGYYSRPWFLELLSRGASNTEEVKFQWQMHDRGGTFRATAHYTGLSSFNPYLLVQGGASLFTLSVAPEQDAVISREYYHSPALRIGVGGGVSTLLTKMNLVVGLELRYLISAVFQRPTAILVDHPFEDGEKERFELRSFHQPSHGFSWIIHFGYRF